MTSNKLSPGCPCNCPDCTYLSDPFDSAAAWSLTGDVEVSGGKLNFPGPAAGVATTSSAHAFPMRVVVRSLLSESGPSFYWPRVEIGSGMLVASAQRYQTWDDSTYTWAPSDCVYVDLYIAGSWAGSATIGDMVGDDWEVTFDLCIHDVAGIRTASCNFVVNDGSSTKVGNLTAAIASAASATVSLTTSCGFFGGFYWCSGIPWFDDFSWYDTTPGVAPCYCPDANTNTDCGAYDPDCDCCDTPLPQSLSVTFDLIEDSICTDCDHLNGTTWVLELFEDRGDCPVYRAQQADIDAYNAGEACPLVGGVFGVVWKVGSTCYLAIGLDLVEAGMFPILTSLIFGPKNIGTSPSIDCAITADLDPYGDYSLLNLCNIFDLTHAPVATCHVVLS